MTADMKCSNLNTEESAELGEAIRSLGLIERDDNRKALLDGKRNGVCPNFAAGCRVVALAHKESPVITDCKMKPCPFDPPAA